MIAGVDEAGRGPWAGPVFAAAVVLPADTEIFKGVYDSKGLSAKKREQWFEIICKHSISYAVAEVSAAIIDEINILQATMLAMQRAIAGLEGNLTQVLIDGNQCPENIPHAKAIINGDKKILQISAASILAKVCRDRHMQTLDKNYPEYAFAQHKGYGTKLHQQNLRLYGPCKEHRYSYKPIQALVKINKN